MSMAAKQSTTYCSTIFHTSAFGRIRFLHTILFFVNSCTTIIHTGGRIVVSRGSVELIPEFCELSIRHFFFPSKIRYGPGVLDGVKKRVQRNNHFSVFTVAINYTYTSSVDISMKPQTPVAGRRQSVGPGPT